MEDTILKEGFGRTKDQNWKEIPHLDVSARQSMIVDDVKEYKSGI